MEEDGLGWCGCDVCQAEQAMEHAGWGADSFAVIAASGSSSPDLSSSPQPPPSHDDRHLLYLADTRVTSLGE